MDGKEWIKKADADLRVAERLFSLNEEPWIIAFHSQQAVEKYLKAFLVYKKVRFKKTHDIREILNLCIKIDKSFIELRKLGIEHLSIYAAAVRYPGVVEPTLEEAKSALEVGRKVREFVLNKIGYESKSKENGERD